MPPPLFDVMQLDNALQNEALPALERLAGSSSLRNRALERRFDPDEPPPYVSSTEDDYEDIVPAPGPVDSAMLDELNRLLDEPLDEDEFRHTAYTAESQYRPGRRYVEVKIEKERIDDWVRSAKVSSQTKDYFVQFGLAKKGRAGRERVNIIARRNIRRRWQKLGVWNPEWGIPGRADNPQPKDNTWKWKWPWQHGDAAAEWQNDLETLSRNSQHPIVRALRLRQGMRRSEHSPVLPRSRLGEDTSASQAESFIMSRPWFMFGLEAAEEWTRHSRLSTRMWQLYESSKVPKTMKLWKERGEWKEEWLPRRRGTVLIGWKWRHESPSPEPEDLSGLDDLTTLELTPSEVDALEAVPPPSPSPPLRVYTPPTGSLFDALPRSSRLLFPDTRPAAPEEVIHQPPAASEEAMDQSPAAPEETIDQSPAASTEATEQPRQRRRRRRQLPSARLLRRSARIAATTANHLAPARPRRRAKKNSNQ